MWRTFIVFFMLTASTFAQVPGLKIKEDNGLDLPVPKPVFQLQNHERPNAGFTMAPIEIKEREPKDKDTVELYGEEINVGKSIIFVIDKSGSMATGQTRSSDPYAGYISRMEIAKRELRQAIIALDDEILFGIVAFDHIVIVWSPNLMSASPGNKAAALAWLDSLVAGGGTETAPGMVTGLHYRTDSAVLLTDGAPSHPEADRIAIRINNIKPTPITVFGIQPYDDRTRSFCINVALDSNGKYIDVQ